MALSSLQLEAFQMLARTQNFTRAAEALYVSQSALSQRILNLEEDLGTTLFIRERGGVRLTETAEDLLRYCQVKESMEGEFLARLKTSDQLGGVVRIAGFSSVMRSVIIPSLAQLLRDAPNVQASFQTRELSHLLSLLKSGEVDFIVSSEILERDDLEKHLLGEEINILVEKTGYEGDIYLDHDEDDRVTLDFLKLTQAKAEKIRRRYLDDVYGLLDGVRLGMGRAVLPRHLLSNEKNLRVIRPSTVLKIPVYLYHYRQPYYSRLHQTVVTELVQRAGKTLAQK